MKNFEILVAASALIFGVQAHSWIESAHRIAPNGTILHDTASNPASGQIGYPRGPHRGQSDFSDNNAKHQLPKNRVTYTDEDTISDRPLVKDPEWGLLGASAGDWIAIRHLENEHTTHPEVNPRKPLNRGTVFIYGTTQPKVPEMLHDVHMKWNRDGNGGDRRGRLIATRNYDDGQCFEDGHGSMYEERFAAHDGVKGKALPCQSDIQLPSDLEAGDIYTIYWYWDWPDLDMDLETTKNGIYPWGGDADLEKKGFKKEMIVKAESYASTLDIKITDKFLEDGLMLQDTSSFEEDQSVYDVAVKNQLTDGNFAVEFSGGEKSDDLDDPDLPDMSDVILNVPVLPRDTLENASAKRSRAARAPMPTFVKAVKTKTAAEATQTDLSKRAGQKKAGKAELEMEVQKSEAKYRVPNSRFFRH